MSRARITLIFDGDLTDDALAAHLEALRQIPAPGPSGHGSGDRSDVGSDDRELFLDLESCDIADGAHIARLVEAIRDASRRLASVVLYRPPQTLAHVLYRIGALRSGAVLQVIEPREELGRSD